MELSESFDADNNYFCFPEILCFFFYIFGCCLSVTFAVSSFLCLSNIVGAQSSELGTLFPLHLFFLVLSASPMQTSNAAYSSILRSRFRCTTVYSISPCKFPRDTSNRLCPNRNSALRSYPAYILLLPELMKASGSLLHFINLHHPLLHAHLHPSGL